MVEARRSAPVRWRVVVQPDGTPEEAAAVAERVLITVAGWVRREAGSAAEPAGGGRGEERSP